MRSTFLAPPRMSDGFPRRPGPSATSKPWLTPRPGGELHRGYVVLAPAPNLQTSRHMTANPALLDATQRPLVSRLHLADSHGVASEADYTHSTGACQRFAICIRGAFIESQGTVDEVLNLANGPQPRVHHDQPMAAKGQVPAFSKVQPWGRTGLHVNPFPSAPAGGHQTVAADWHHIHWRISLPSPSAL